jgi:ataxia telangiectasia mutated family protein
MALQELEPLPGLDCLKDIQEFHASLSASYASRDQFLKVPPLDIIFFFT